MKKYYLNTSELIPLIYSGKSQSVGNYSVALRWFEKRHKWFAIDISQMQSDGQAETIIHWGFPLVGTTIVLESDTEDNSIGEITKSCTAVRFIYRRQGFHRCEVLLSAAEGVKIVGGFFQCRFALDAQLKSDSSQWDCGKYVPVWKVVRKLKLF